MSKPSLELLNLCINTIRFLSIDAIERAKSGHPGMPLGASPMAFVLWDLHMKFNPRNPKWLNRDRFILSCGHGSMLLYSLLYLFGFDVTVEDLKKFRSLNSKTPGHPERDLSMGVEVTTGPLGQGLGNAVGLAIAEAYLGAILNEPGFDIIDHYTFAIVSDGDLMEGISYEVSNLAGHFGLGKLIVLWDDNGITIDGPTDLAWSENIESRFKACNWHYLWVKDGNDVYGINDAIRKAKRVLSKPSLIRVSTRIGYGSPKEGKPQVHGTPLTKEEVEITRKNLGWDFPPFHVPDEVLDYTRRHIKIGEELERLWWNKVEKYKDKYPEKWGLLKVLIEEDITSIDLRDLAKFSPFEKIPTRRASGIILKEVVKRLPLLIGGSADLTESNFFHILELERFSKENRKGRYIHFGVREHAMGAITNGISAHSGLIPFCGTFLVFSDYMRPSIRIACMSHLKVVYVFTHDSIGVGEDGPTHQPVEQLPSLQIIPNMVVIRPCDANEAVYAWEVAINLKNQPTALILTRQPVPVLDRNRYPDASNLRYGAYVLKESPNGIDIILMASGSEVHIALEVHSLLEERGIKVRTISFPSFQLFEMQPLEYRERVLPREVKRRVSIEASNPSLWYKYVGPEGLVIGIHEFGKSAPFQEVYDYFNLTSHKICEKITEFFKFNPE